MVDEHLSRLYALRVFYALQHRNETDEIRRTKKTKKAWILFRTIDRCQQSAHICIVLHMCHMWHCSKTNVFDCFCSNSIFMHRIFCCCCFLHNLKGRNTGSGVTSWTFSNIFSIWNSSDEHGWIMDMFWNIFRMAARTREATTKTKLKEEETRERARAATARLFTHNLVWTKRLLDHVY